MPATSSAMPTQTSASSALIVVSIVVYRPDPDWLDTTLLSLREALIDAHQRGEISRADVLLIDNEAAKKSDASSLSQSRSQSRLRSLLSTSTSTSTSASTSSQNSGFHVALKKWFGPNQVWLHTGIIAGHGNVGYGQGNNLAIAAYPKADFHLVLNPDVTLSRDAISQALHYLKTHHDCAMVTPIATAEDGTPLHLVKAYPGLFTLLLRGFAPQFVRNLFAERLNAYDRAEVAFDAPITDAKIASGCFMLMRRAAIDLTGGFDPNFFLYFEDFDLSYRISQIGQLSRLDGELNQQNQYTEIHRVPNCRIVHAGGQASRKGWRHIALFTRSAVRFFVKHGWRMG